jgi:hypothetical protein
LAGAGEGRTVLAVNLAAYSADVNLVLSASFTRNAL